MFPILVTVYETPIHSYSVAIVLGYMVCVMILLWSSQWVGLPFVRTLDASFLSVVLGFLGARLGFFFTVESGEISSYSLFSGGGLVFYGGFLLAMMGLLLYCRFWNLAPLMLLDALAPALALAHSIGRLGCFLAGCCHGSPTALPWGVSLNSGLVAPPMRGTPLHPVQLYESMGLLIIFFSLVTLLRRKQRPGRAALLYLGSYAGLRFCIEFFRGDSSRGFWGPLSYSQWISLVLFGCALGGALILRSIRRHN